MLLDKLCEGNLNLVDALFTSFENGLNPTLSHRYLSFLQPKLGIPLLLTTNFDSLLERAFHQEGIPPKVFDIHRDAELPNPILVHRQLSLLKLHGSAYGLRFGERLKYTLESDARNNALGYIPKDALMLVMGFNGSERRIMQMLQAFVQEREQGSDKPRLIWIQGPGEPGPLFYELHDNSGGSVKRIDVSHIDAFLQELYFYTTSNSYQSSAWGYSTVPNRPLTKVLEPFPANTKEEKAQKRRPVHLFISKIKDQPSSNWSSLAGMRFVNSLDGYTIIRIDLENHHTVEGIITEFFNLVRVVDPQAPSCAISNMDNSNAAGTIIEKAVQRILDVFKRGRYVLVLDLVESFGRPQMVHHGMLSSYPAKKKEKERFTRQVKNLRNFLDGLLGLKKKGDPLSSGDYWDSYVIVTADKPRLRHLKQDINSFSYNLIKKQVVDFLQKIKENEYSHIHVDALKGRKESKKKYSTLISKNNIPGNDEDDDPSINLIGHWKRFGGDTLDHGDAEDRSLKRSKDALSLLDMLRSKADGGADAVDNKPEKLSQKETIGAFICLLSVFRRPRSLPLLRSMIERWGLRQIGDDAINTVAEKDAINTHKEIDKLLQLIANKNPAVGVVSQNHEGGIVWLFREVYEAAYDALTENIHRQAWKNPSEPQSSSAAIMDGILSITWHLFAARAYYVEVFLATRDIRAFWEYLYHRVSAIRYITLLISVIEEDIEEDKEGELWKKLNTHCEKIDYATYGHLPDTDPPQSSPFVRYAWVLGIFGAIEQDVGANLGQLSGAKELVGHFKVLRKNSLDTLYMAVKKNQLLFRKEASPR